VHEPPDLLLPERHPHDGLTPGRPGSVCPQPARASPARWSVHRGHAWRHQDGPQSRIHWAVSASRDDSGT
jgi:hypothetical protein